MSDDERDWTLCPCGEGAHYTSPAVRAAVATMISNHGPTLLLALPDTGRVAVPRAYISLHGFRTADLPDLAATYGWETFDAEERDG